MKKLWTRRKFFQSTLLASGAAALWPAIPGCKKVALMDGNKFNGKVAIVGAGVAGLYAAWLLQQNGIEVTIYEATAAHGGRIRPLKNFASAEIEIGAEEIHGSHSVWFDLIRTTNAIELERDWQDYFFVDNILHAENQFTGDPDLARVIELTDNFDTYGGPEMSAEDYGNISGVAGRVKHVYEAWTGNERGTSNTRIGMKGLVFEAQKWSSGFDNRVLANRTLLSIIEEKFSSVLPSIRYNTPIKAIKYSVSPVELTDASDAVHTADRVLVAVPQPIITNRNLQFIPSLPPEHWQAITAMQCDRGMKVILKFSDMFWPADTDSLFIPGVVPEFWMPAGNSASLTDHVLTAFVMGEAAEYLFGLGEEGMLQAILDQLGSAFGQDIVQNAFIDHHTMDWGSEPYFQGAYSYIKTGADPASRNAIGNPAGQIYFAGEYTHTEGHHASVHGAMETAARAAFKIMKA